jgi:LacI family transcriptional regulator
MSFRVTIADVARAAGVHPSTVSRALNPTTRDMVTQAVAARVAEVADRLGWRPSAVAAGLRTRKSRTIGILVPDLVNPVFPPIVRAAEARLAEAGYVALLANTDTDAAREALLIERMAAHLVDGLMLASAASGSRALELCERLRIPVVLINRRLPDACVPAVVNDDRRGMALAVRHLVDLGHTHIGHIAGPPGVSTAADRQAGFLAALAAAGLDDRPAPIVAADAYTAAAGRLAMERLLATHRFSAVAVANDMLCLGAYDALAAAGLAVGTDISVTGFNDMPFVDRISPPLTTVRIQHAEMGRQAAKVLIAEMANGTPMSRDIVLEPELVVRSSSGPPAAASPGKPQVVDRPWRLYD